MIRHLVTAALALCATAGMAAAQSCAELPGDPRLPPPGDEFEVMQETLAAALALDTPRLRDGIPGPTTSRALQELCTVVPVAGAQTPADATLDLIVEYARLSDAVPGWLDALSGLAGSGALSDPDNAALPLRLAGPVSMTAPALRGDPAPPDCSGLDANALSADAREGLGALASADPRLAAAADPLARACALYPVTGGTAALSAGLTRFARLAEAREGALITLASPDFAAWLTQEPVARLRRLAGTRPAVERLLADYADATGAVPPDAPPPSTSPASGDLPASCAPDPGALTYTSFLAADAARLTEAQQVRPPLQGITDTFDTQAALLDAVFTALGADLSRCVRDRIRQLASGPDSVARVYQLDQTGVESLAFLSEFADMQAVVEGLVGRRAPTEAALLDGTGAAIRRAVSDAVMAEVELAADTIAAAAETLPPLFDIPAEGVPEFDIEEAPPMIVLTELTDATLAATLENEAFVEAIAGTEFQAAPNAEVLKGDVRRTLAPIAQEQIDAAVHEATARLPALVDAQWAVTPDLIEAIAAIPQLVESFAVPEDAIAEVVGLTYPNQRLMAQAFRATDAPREPAAFERAMQLATKTVEDTFSPRASGDFAEQDCGCVSRRQDFSLVYGFYPFWLSPVLPGPSGNTVETSPDPAGDQDARPAPLPIDYTLVERVAFWGIEYGATRAADGSGGQPALRNDHHWETMKEDFIASAHRHRAKADVVVTLRGWADWTNEQVLEAVEDVVGLTARYERMENLSFATLRADLPTLFDRPGPDGLTVKFEGYNGDGTNPHADRVIEISARLSDALKARKIELSLLIDPPVVGTRGNRDLSGGLLDDLAPLLNTGAATERAIREALPFDRILMFLERPTTDAKKIIRFRMENGVYRGAVRRELLRRILPVIPPGGHEHVRASGLSEENAPFSQFVDDLVYFQDNFGGMGFWPIPQSRQPEFAQVRDLTTANWDRWRFPSRLSHWEEGLSSVCYIVCPNRIYFGGAATLIALVTGVLVARSFYSGLADRIAFRLGVAWIGAVVLLVLLGLLAACDQAAVLAPMALTGLIVLLVVVLVFNTYQAAQNGPKP